LGTLGSAYAFTNALNNRGQVIGGSSLAADPGACAGIGNTANCHPFLWRKGKLIDLNTTTIGGNPLGANEINDAGEIIGAAAFPDAPYDAYLWRNGVAIDLGRLDGDCYSEAWAINSEGQVVGNSLFCDGFSRHAFLWENGSIVDLNTLIPPGSSLQLVLIGPFSFSPVPGPINDRGEIAGTGVPPGVDPRNVQTQGHAFLLIPCDENHPGVEGCDYSMVEGSAAPSAVPAAREAFGHVPLPALRRNNWFHFPSRAIGPRN
jgi:probable HAF family extracellular repeat protein